MLVLVVPGPERVDRRSAVNLVVVVARTQEEMLTDIFYGVHYWQTIILLLVKK